MAVTYKYGKNIKIGDRFKITRPDGSIIHVNIKRVGVEQADGTHMLTDGSESADSTGTPQGIDIGNYTDTFTIEGNSHNYAYTLNWSNCFSFGNGVESNRVRDSFNSPFLTPGVKVSTIFENYEEEKRSTGLIYSGIYNSNSGVNNLNQFIQAEKITKDLNPTYGSIQKLYTRDSDLVVLCEDKVIKVLANKDALYNADGNPQLVANQNVLGQAIPFAGNYGISKNPESFISEAYRSYFTDRQRGVVLRLSKDGLTPISDAGMKDYFRDNLKNAVYIDGGYDIKKDELNITTTYVKPINVNIQEAKINGNNGTTFGWEKEGNGEFGYDSTRTAVQYEKVIIPFKKSLSGWSSGGKGVGIVEGADYKIKFTLAFYNGNLQGDLTLKLFNHVQPKSSLQINSEMRHFHVHADRGEWYGNVVGGTVIRRETSSNQLNWEYDYEVIFNEENYPDRFNYTTSYENYPNSLVFQSKQNDDGTLFNGAVKNVSIERIDHPAKTISYKENVKGWTSFKSFLPESSVSCSGDYYSFKKGLIYRHHEEDVDRNTFYNHFTPSTLEVLLNDQPSSIKSFHTINYEGSKSKIDENEDTSIDTSYYNLTATDGWYVDNIYTDINKGQVNEFIEKEGKYFNYIKGVSENINDQTDFGSTTIQGLGILDNNPDTTDEVDDGLGTNTFVTAPKQIIDLMFKGPANVSLQKEDAIYYVKSSNIATNIKPEDIIKYPNPVFQTNQYSVGNVMMNRVRVVQDVNAAGAVVLEKDDYFMFSKDSTINNSSLIGYYASVNLVNNSKEKMELFTLASDVSESSK